MENISYNNNGVYNLSNNNNYSSSLSSLLPDQMDYNNNNGVASTSADNGTLPPLSKNIELGISGEEKLNSEPKERKGKKAINFPINSLKIGTWKKTACDGDQLKARWYFIREKKLVWEIMGNPMQKIEIQLSNIGAINGDNGVIEIMLRERPLFYHEVEPQPLKHTKWVLCKDFTDNEQASNVRFHTVTLNPQVLERYYHSIVTGHDGLHNISKQKFPYTSNPYFPRSDDSSNEVQINKNTPSVTPPLQISPSDYDNDNVMSNSFTQYDNPLELLPPLNQILYDYDNDSVTICYNNPLELLSPPQQIVLNQFGGNTIPSHHYSVQPTLNQVIAPPSLHTWNQPIVPPYTEQLDDAYSFLNAPIVNDLELVEI